MNKYKMKLGINVKEIESIIIHESYQSHAGYDWYDVRPEKRFLFFKIESEITVAGYYKNIGWDSEYLSGPYTPEEIASEDNTLYVDRSKPIECCLYKKPSVTFNMRSKNYHSFYFNTLQEIEQEINEILAQEPDLKIHWIQR